MGLLRDVSSLVGLFPVGPLRRPRAFAYAYRMAQGDGSAGPQNAAQARAALGLPDAWTYDRVQLDATSRRLADAAWQQHGCGAEVYAIVRAKILLVAKQGDGLSTELYASWCAD